MTLKVAVFDQLGENVLHKGGNGAGIKPKLLLVSGNEMLGEHHISDAQGGGNGFGERVQIDHVIVLERENRVSVGLVETENSDSKSSSIIYRAPSLAQRTYSCRLDAVAVTPLG